MASSELVDGDLHLPDEVVASEFLTMEGKQLSTSRAVAIYVRDVLERYDPDPVRYFLTAAGPETQDSDFSWAEFLRRNNDELLANWGNLVNRTLTNAHRNFGEVPVPGELTGEDRQVLAAIESGFDTVGELIAESKFKQALAETMRLSSLGNQYVDDQAPWAVIKKDRERAATILYVALRVVDRSRCFSRRSCRSRARSCTNCSGTRAGSPGRSSFARSRRTPGEARRF